TLGILRGTISSASHPAQTFVLTALKSTEFQTQRLQKFEILKKRACKVKQILDHGDYNDAWDYYPFNSGYFMCLKLKGVDAEALRVHLLEQYGVGVISLGESDIRVAFSCVEEEELKDLFDLIYQGYQDLAK
ncbi:MAG: aminotransferase class I/II-fold pyridoxal phosphate-dependent enzyme, partial [Desulfosporosinus sp.]|nr:aminotransferase class I/II-fold pyridoxal phosphate-dependent enzyme [Desulfosporosinus sp.]